MTGLKKTSFIGHVHLRPIGTQKWETTTISVIKQEVVLQILQIKDIYKYNRCFNIFNILYKLFNMCTISFEALIGRNWWYYLFSLSEIASIPLVLRSVWCHHQLWRGHDKRWPPEYSINRMEAISTRKIGNSMNTFRSRLQIGIQQNGRHIERII